MFGCVLRQNDNIDTTMKKTDSMAITWMEGEREREGEAGVRQWIRKWTGVRSVAW